MEPVTLVATALVAGATAGITATTAEAVADLYKGLKSLVVQRFQRVGVAKEAAEELIAGAVDGATGRQELEQRLAEVGIDPLATSMARRLLLLVNQQSRTFHVDASQARGIQIGDHNTQHNTFN